MGILETILPPQAVAVEAFGDVAGAVLLGHEERIIDRAVDARRREFTTVRHCARQAMKELGISPVPILRDEKGAPLWPEGVVGSMTHCAGYRAAVLAPASALLSIGIDAEPDEPLPEGVGDQIMSAHEKQMIHDCAGTAPGVPWDRLVFCAKESVYKAWYPLAKRWLGFLDAEVSFARDRRFEVKLNVPGVRLDTGRLVGFRGRWHADRGLLATAVAEVVVAP